MALSRRKGNRFDGAIWPGYVDAVTGLLMVLTFVLTIFMVVQFILRETITGQESELDQLTGEISVLSRALGLARDRANRLEGELGDATQSLEAAQAEIASQASLIDTLTIARAEQDAALQDAQQQITSFEAQVAGLLAQQSQTSAALDAMTAERDDLISDKDALQIALAQARQEIDTGAEEARLAAARREALEAMIADLERQAAEDDDARTALTAQVADLQASLSDEEKARLAEAAAAEALRAKLADADAELTAMTLALEEQRRKAEETLTLLAAAEEAEDDLDLKLAAALAQTEDAAAVETFLRDQVAELQGDLETRQDELAQAAARIAALEATLAEEQSGRLALQQELAGLSAEQQDAAELATELAERRARADADATRITSLEQRITALEDQIKRTASDRAAEQAAAAEEVKSLEDRLAAALSTRDAGAIDRDELKRQLAAALAAKLAAEQAAEQQMTEAEQRAALLSEANKRLETEQAQSAEAQRQTTLLNQQVAQMRTQLARLQGLLDDYKARDEENQVQIQSLGSDLNQALAQKAAEERRRRQLEEAERKRLEAERERLVNERDQLEKYKSEFFGLLRDLFAGQDGIQVVGDRFVFSSEVLFAPGSADLSDEGRAQIASITDTLQDLVDEIPDQIDWVLRVDGHTDDVPLLGTGEFRDNWELSQGRALSVVRYMTDVLGFPPNRLAANGFGQYQPIAQGDTEEARAANRRIELKFTER